MHTIFDVEVMDRQPHAPVHVLGNLGPPVRAQVEQYAIPETFQASNLGMCLEVARGAHRIDPVMEQRPADVAIPHVRHLGDEDIRIDPGLHGKKVLGGYQIEVDVRVAIEEAGEPVRHPQCREGRRAADGQGAPGVAAIVLANACRGLGNVDEGQLGCVEENGSGAGQFDRASDALEQGRAEMLLQLADLAADRGLGHA
ncbi:hypothetical protein D3C78_1167360 [compost metagenome]